MKHMIVILSLLAPTVALANTQVFTFPSQPGQVQIQITGGKGSQAEVLYNSLSQIPEQPDDAMGGRHGLDKQGRDINCSVENDIHVTDSYMCLIEFNTKGDALPAGT